MERLGMIDAGSFQSGDIIASAKPTKQVPVIIAKVSAATAGEAVPGVHTLTLTTQATAGDKLVINGVDYEFVSSAAAGKVLIGANTTADATALATLLNANSAISKLFTVTSNTNKVLFTQKTAEKGDLPEADVAKGASGTLAITIETTTVGHIATETIEAGQVLSRGCMLGKKTSDSKCYPWDPTATDGTGVLFGILAESVDSTSDDVTSFCYVSGEFIQQNLSAKAGVTIPTGSMNFGSITIQEEV